MRAANTDFEEQASGWLALFWNDNGNVSVCQVTFASLQQAKDWAIALLARDGYTKLRKEARAVTAVSRTSEHGYRFIPTLVADSDTAGKDISFDHVHTIR